MGFQKFVCVMTVLTGWALAASAQNQPQVKHVPAPQTSAASGSEMYKAYCAACHGTDGKGNGPAAPALKTPPTDLTTLSKNNAGKFPSAKIASSLRGEDTIPAHGSREMPVWGRVFWSMSHGHEGEVQQRVSNLTKYIESLQVK